MKFDNERIVVERLGKGSLVNSFNFIVEEELQLTATIASKSSTIYQISKSAFFDIATHDKKLLQHILKMLIDDVKNLDPPLNYLDFIKPMKYRKWQSKFGQKLNAFEEDLDKAESLTKEMKQLVFRKTLELR